MHRIPAQIRNSVLVLESAAHTGKIFMVGVAHVGSKSKEDCRAVVEAIKPKAIFLELCDARSGYLRAAPRAEWPGGYSMKNMIKAYSKSRNEGRAYIDSYMSKTFGKMGVKPGEEFKVTYDTAFGIDENTKCILGDRPQEITQIRMFKPMTIMEKAKVAFSALKEVLLFMKYVVKDGGITCKDGKTGYGLSKDMNAYINNLKEVESDERERLKEEMRSQVPWMFEVLTAERDMYMGIYMKRVMNANGVNRSKYKTIELIEEGEDMVAVVGSAHLQGIEKEWNTIREQEKEDEILMAVTSTDIDEIEKAKILVEQRSV